MPLEVAVTVHCAVANGAQTMMAKAANRTVGRNGLDIGGGHASRGATGRESNTVRGFQVVSGADQ